jgi:inhibitor of cysteine peptidase
VTTIEIDEDGAAAPHPAARGDHVVIRLPESPSSGYRWQLDTYDKTVLQPAQDEFVGASDAMTGGGGTRVFRFVVESSEHTDVALSLRREWEAEVAAVRLFRTAINGRIEPVTRP